VHFAAHRTRCDGGHLRKHPHGSQEASLFRSRGRAAPCRGDHPLLRASRGEAVVRRRLPSLGGPLLWCRLPDGGRRRGAPRPIAGTGWRLLAGRSRARRRTRLYEHECAGVARSALSLPLAAAGASPPSLAAARPVPVSCQPGSKGTDSSCLCDQVVLRVVIGVVPLGGDLLPGCSSHGLANRDDRGPIGGLAMCP